MKKFKLLVLLVLTLAVALFSFTSCDQIKDLAGNVPGLDKLIDKLPGGEDEHVHAFGDATCTAPKTCECGATEGEPLGHNFVDGKCACGATDPNYVPETPEHTHNFVDGKCECGESDPNYVPPHTHEFVNGKCECGEIDPDYVPETPGESANVEITVDSLGVATQMYSAGTATIGGVNFEFVQIGNYGDGIQVRDKDGKTSMLWNTTAFKSPIAKIVLVYSDTKDVSYANPDAEIFSFGNEAKGATYTVKLSTTAGVKNYEIVPDAETYTYLYFEHDLGYTFYWKSITIVLADGSTVTPDTPEHTHNFVDGKCECGETDPNYVPPHTHEFVNGKCECGESDPNYVPETPTVNEYKVATTIKAGDHVLIAAHAHGKLLSVKKVSTYYNLGVNYSDTDFTNVTDDEIFVVGVDENGNYTFTSLSGKVIAMAASNNSLNDTGVNTGWVLEAKSDGIFYVKNAVRGTYLEWYASKNNWSTYYNDKSDLFEISFYVKSAGSTDTPDTPEHTHNFVDGKCECGESDPNYVPPHTHEFVNGKCECGETDPDYVPETPDVPTVGGGTADFDTIKTTNANGDSTYTKTYTTESGWQITNSAIQAGGTKDSNPQFTVIGPDNTHKAVCLNGKVGAVGTLTSPTLKDGLSKLTINYSKMFTDTLLSVTVKVTEIATGKVYEHTISAELPKDEKYQVYVDVWTLEIPVTGDFTIEIVNNAPSNNSSNNKDRMTILDITWEGAAPTNTNE